MDVTDPTTALAKAFGIAGSTSDLDERRAMLRRIDFLLVHLGMLRRRLGRPLLAGVSGGGAEAQGVGL